MNEHDQPTFSALQFVEQQLTEDQLEYIAEFSDQIESLRFLTRSFKGPTPTLEQAIEIVDAAPVVLQKRRRRRRGSGQVSDATREWHEELGSEFLSARDRKGERLPAVLSRGEIDELLDASRHKTRDYMLFRLFYATGCRISELAKPDDELIKPEVSPDNSSPPGLLVGDLYIPELKIFIRDGKGDKDRYVMMDPETARMLAEFVAGRAPGEPVFDIGERQISRVIQRYADEVGIIERYAAIKRKFTPHCLRHTCATHLYESGMDIYIIQEMLGHTSISVTREYVHIGINRLRTFYQAHHPFCRTEKDQD